MTRLFIALKILCLTLAPLTQASELRLVSLTPAITETLQALGLGEQIVGQDEASDLATPVVANYQQVNIEAVIRLKPTHVIAWEDSLPTHLAARLADFDIPLLIHRTRTLNAWLNSSTEIAIALNVSHQPIQAWRSQLAELGATYQDRPPVRAAWLFWDRPLMVSAGAGYLSELLALCGATNVYGELDQVSATIDPESLFRRQPDLFIADTAWIDALPMRATLNGTSWQAPADLLSRPGPRLLEGASQLCKAVDLRRAQL